MEKLMLLFLMCCSSLAFAQKYEAFSEQSDSDSKKILNNLRAKYEAYKGLRARYSLVIRSSEKEEKQQGEVMQQGNKYRIEYGGNLLVSDGETVWTYTKSINEVQINTYSPEENEDEWLSPDKILKVYENEDDFLVSPPLENDSECAIEMKPRSEDTDFFKIRITISKANNELRQVIIFGHHNLRYTFDIEEIKSASIASAYFKFDKSKYPGVEEIDLRED